MLDHDAAAAAPRAIPVLPGLLPTQEYSPPPPLPIRRVAVASSALSSICSPERWHRWAGDTVDPARPAAVILADLLFRIFSLGPAASTDWMRPIIMVRGQNPVHQQHAPAAPAPVVSNLPPAPADPARGDTHAAAGTVPAGAPPSPTGNAPAGRQDRMHRGAAAAFRTLGATPVASPGSRERDGQNPMHREATIGRPVAATASGPIGVGPLASSVPGPFAATRTAAVTNTPAPAPDRGKRTQPPTNADPYGAPATTRPHGKDLMHRDNAAGAQLAPPSPPHAARQNPTHHEQRLTLAPPRTGPLRNGNPRGNPNAAPRCGAKTRSGCPCKAPALRGKLRCRMHGGASTGPRTAEGLQRLRDARTTHGRYTAHSRARSRFLLSFARRGRVERAALRHEARLPPIAAMRLVSFPPELTVPPYPSPGQKPLSRAEDRAFASAEAEALAPWKSAIAAAKASRHLPAIPPDEARELDRLFAVLPRPAPHAIIASAGRTRCTVRRSAPGETVPHEPPAVAAWGPMPPTSASTHRPSAGEP